MISLLVLVVCVSALIVFLATNARTISRSRGALKEWAESNDGELVGDRARLKGRREIEAFLDINHPSTRVGWAARTSGLGISGATTLWIARRRRDNFLGGARTQDEAFDRDFFIGGDGGDQLGEVLHLPRFRSAVRVLFERVNPAAVELDVDGNLVVRTGRLRIDADGTRALLEGTAAFVDALTALAHEVKQRQRALSAGTASISVGSESGAPMPVPAQRE